jgi:pimeloyl-ACP methyl ester carboxylesterase
MRTFLACLVLLLAAPAFAEPLPASIVADPPQDRAHPAGMIAFALPTKGTKINAVLYTASGGGKHPTVLLLHGLPGNEQNLDLARAMQREGWNVLTLHYRGSWGSRGDFTFTHCIEDADAALAWLRNPDTAAASHIDATKIAIVGHSMGGFVTGYVAGHDPALLGAGLISAANLGGMGALPKAAVAQVIEQNIENNAGMHTLGDATAERLADEAIRMAKDWDITAFGVGLAKHPLLVVSSNDGLAAGDEAIAKATEAAGGAPVTRVHLETDHSYNDQRIALEAAVIRWLENLPGAPAGL